MPKTQDAKAHIVVLKEQASRVEMAAQMAQVEAQQAVGAS